MVANTVRAGCAPTLVNSRPPQVFLVLLASSAFLATPVTVTFGKYALCSVQFRLEVARQEYHRVRGWRAGVWSCSVVCGCLSRVVSVGFPLVSLLVRWGLGEGEG